MLMKWMPSLDWQKTRAGDRTQTWTSANSPCCMSLWWFHLLHAPSAARPNRETPLHADVVGRRVLQLQWITIATLKSSKGRFPCIFEARVGCHAMLVLVMEPKPSRIPSVVQLLRSGVRIQNVIFLMPCSKLRQQLYYNLIGVVSQFLGGEIALCLEDQHFLFGSPRVRANEPRREAQDFLMFDLRPCEIPYNTICHHRARHAFDQYNSMGERTMWRPGLSHNRTSIPEEFLCLTENELLGTEITIAAMAESAPSLNTSGSSRLAMEPLPGIGRLHFQIQEFSLPFHVEFLLISSLLSLSSPEELYGLVLIESSSKSFHQPKAFPCSPRNPQ
ncbi:hypothetical protein VNO77_15842 [Canavalia gladiata]|uniref:Uncharacterized protein n=1 Tax=Canavalia gladiata TaxID=3824 RepID=A0AAN9M4R5_CANGL